MPVITPYRLTFRSGLHLGTRGVNLEEAGQSIPSDTLFSALVDAWRRRGRSVEAFMQPFVAQPVDPPFLLTSAFPFVGEILFFPMPVDLTRLFKPETIQKRGKDLKRIRYISPVLLHKALGGQLLDDHLFPEDDYAEPEYGVALQKGAFWFSSSELSQLPREFQRGVKRRHSLSSLSVWSAGRVPRVSVSRITSATNLFHAGRVSFAKSCGLWFGVQWLKPEVKVKPDNTTFAEAFEHALAFLADDGIGGERSVGYGAFNSQKGEALTLEAELQIGKPAFLLSRYHPMGDELPTALNSAGTAYRLTSVGGWLRSLDGPAQRRKRIYLVAEGSLVTPTKFPTGDVCDVQPTYQNPTGDLPHPVYRYGLACMVGWPNASQRRSK
jgi:CRISPR-associated protein Csm4